MRSKKEYDKAKAEFIKVKDLNSNNIYDYFKNEKEITLIQRYYELFSQVLFNNLVGSLRLEVDSAKREKLIELKGDGKWKFAGMIDNFNVPNSKCELGHSIRYVYKAVNEENGQTLNFGSRCVGDFFELDEKGIKALDKLKDTMFSELKDIIAIRELDLWDEYYFYDCKELGGIIKVCGAEGIKKFKDLNPLMPIMYNFVLLQLPMPKSLLDGILKNKEVIISEFSKGEILGINMIQLDSLRNSDIPLISQMFTNSYADLIDNLLKGDENVESDFYNFRNVNDLNIAISHWINRNERILKIQDYFKSQGIESPWLSIYKYMIENTLYRDNPKLYYSVELLLVFDRGVVVQSSVYMPKDYGYKGYQLSKKAHEDFDDILTYLSSKEVLMCIREVDNSLSEVNKEIEAKTKYQEDMLSFLYSNLEDEKYSDLRGIDGVKDIVLKKKLDIDSMSSKQLSYVESVYKSMLRLNNGESETPINMEDVNNRYALTEKPEVLEKIQRLQNEVTDLPILVSNISKTVLKSKFVSDKQLAQINKAFDKYILHKEVPETKVIQNDNMTNKKWNLIECPDVKEKIVALKRHSEYVNIPDSIKNIFSNILKYNTVSDKQIEVVEKTYCRHFGG